MREVLGGLRNIEEVTWGHRVLKRERGRKEGGRVGGADSGLGDHSQDFVTLGVMGAIGELATATIRSELVLTVPSRPLLPHVEATDPWNCG